MLHIAWVDGLPLLGTPKRAGLHISASYTPVGLTYMRGRIFASPLYANLDPPIDLCARPRGLAELYTSWSARVSSSDASCKVDGARDAHAYVKLKQRQAAILNCATSSRHPQP